MRNVSFHPTKSGPGRQHGYRDAIRKDKAHAIMNAVPQTLCRYAKRYGVDVFTIIALQTQATKLDRRKGQRGWGTNKIDRREA